MTITPKMKDYSRTESIIKNAITNLAFLVLKSNFNSCMVDLLIKINKVNLSLLLHVIVLPIEN